MPDYVDTCIFCKIAAGELNTEFVAESENVVAFNDISPAAPVHVLVVPKAHIESANHLGADQVGIWQEMLEVAQEVARKTGIAESGYRMLTNSGPESGQEVMHLHVHVVGGRKLGRIA